MTLTGPSSPNRGKFCSQPGTLPKTSDLPIQPSLAEQLGLHKVQPTCEECCNDADCDEVCNPVYPPSMAERFPQLPADASMADRLERDEAMLAWSNGGSE